MRGKLWHGSCGEPLRQQTTAPPLLLPVALACSPPGTYSGEGAAECTPCPTGQYSPTSGMADQEEGGNGVHCLLCPTGSIALADGETINTTATIGGADFRNERPLSTGATQCDAW